MANPLDTQRTDLQNQEGRLDPKPQLPQNYRPNKRKRAVRRQVYDRYYWLRGDPLRQEAELDWEIADKEYAQHFTTPDADEWRSALELPDAFAAVQSDMQEGIERRSRPTLRPVEDSDEPLAEFSNAVINYNMDNTGFDYQYYLAKMASRIRGTAFLMDYWRVEKRVVKDPTGLNKDTGDVDYADKEITDFDDDYTEWVPNEFIYLDEKAKDVDEAVDMFRREIINIEEFRRIYGSRPGFFDTQYVVAGGDVSTKSFFQLPHDIAQQDVEVLHYYNRSIDAYWVVANNILVHDSPLPTKHKELPIAALHCYRVPGRFWSMGIPKIIHNLVEERKAIRRLGLDRQKLNIAGAFLHNSSFDIDDEDATVQPGRFISIDTNGQPINNAITKLEFGDVPASSFRTEEILLDDITRATGINPLAEAQATGGTATQAAILKENTLKRINMLALTSEMSCIVRLGRLKWSNIQFFYPIPRMQKITEDGEEQSQKVYRTVAVNNRKFDIVSENGKKALKMQDIQGGSALKLDKAMAKYLEFSYDITVDADIFTPVSKAIEQTKKTELFGILSANPAILATLDINGAVADLLTVNNIKPDRWMRNPEGSKKDMMMLAESENMVMAAGQPLDGTEGASEDHTLVHLMYAKTQEFMMLPHEIQQIIMDHILQEHDANPATGASADLMGAYGLGQPSGPEAGGPPTTGGPGLPAPTTQVSAPVQPQPQVADLQATNYAAPA